VSWTNKNISVIGAGVGNTVITRSGGSAFTINMSNPTQNWRVSGMTISGSNAGVGVITLGSNGNGATSPTKGWRVDNMRFNYASGGPIFWFQGITWGLIDHVTFDGTSYQVSLYEGWMGSSNDENGSCSGTAPNVCFGHNAWNRPTRLGTDEAVYFENVAINLASPSASPVVSDLLAGGAAVIRFSTINSAYFITHSARYNLRGGKSWEVYHNTFDGRGAFRWANVRSGTGVAFNNTVSGYQNDSISVDGQREVTANCAVSNTTLLTCNGTRAWDNNTEASGWPCLDQIGRGGGAGSLDRASVQTWMPWYAWTNGSTSTCASGEACNNSAFIELNACGSGGTNYWKTIGSPHVNGEVDYVNNANVGKGTLAARPSTCVKGSGYWATDQGSWNSTPGGSQGVLYRCVSTNTWQIYYTPYTYPHPLVSGSSTSAPPPEPLLPPQNLRIQ
jgi:hypothetical protein